MGWPDARWWLQRAVGASDNQSDLSGLKRFRCRRWEVLAHIVTNCEVRQALLEAMQGRWDGMACRGVSSA